MRPAQQVPGQTGGGILFQLKRRPAPALAAAAFLLGASLLAARLLRISPYSRPLSIPAAFVAAAGVLAVDGLLLLVLRQLAPGRFPRLYHNLADSFTGQKPAAWIAGSVLAASEEVFFRGVVLTFLLEGARLPLFPSLLLTSALFGASHVLPGSLRWFAIWAGWEGVLLGGVYLVSGSLATVSLAHAVHDAVGFAVFARERSRRDATRRGSEPPRPDAS